MGYILSTLKAVISILLLKPVYIYYPECWSIFIHKTLGVGMYKISSELVYIYYSQPRYIYITVAAGISILPSEPVHIFYL